MKRCVIISGAPGADLSFIKSCICQTDFILCADSGYQYAKKACVQPDLVIGDFDSCTERIADGTEVLKLSVRKDETDTLACVKEALKQGCDSFVFLAAAGGRTDHTYANLCVLLFLAQKNIPACICSETETLWIFGPGFHQIEDKNGKTFSVFPFGCESVRVSYIGDVEYPLSDFKLKADFPIGISNVIRSDVFTLKITEGFALVSVNEGI